MGQGDRDDFLYNHAMSKIICVGRSYSSHQLLTDRQF
jgi:hypothetical protein